MSCYVLVYREGDEKVIRGVKCELKRVTIGEAERLKKDGWKGSVSELYSSGSDDLESRFSSDPKELTKDELKEYAKRFNLKLSKRMLEDNMITAILEAKGV